jgi:hypothetical protein
MYINKNPCKVFPKGTPLPQIFGNVLDVNTYINVLLENGKCLAYKFDDYFNPSSIDWVQVIKITINYAENIIEIEEVFSYLYPQIEKYESNEGC